MKRERLTAVKQIDLVDFLSSLGFRAQKIVSNDYWFVAPWREEKTASFKVNRSRRIWFDHGIGKGGTNIDFCIHYYGDSFDQAVARLENFLSFHQPSLPLSPAVSAHPSGQAEIGAERLAGEKRKIKVISADALSAPALIWYAAQRGINLELLQQHCKEVVYEFGGRQYYAIGFPNNQGGYELRSAHFKGSSSPKACTFIDNGGQDVAVFEGFFSFLSFFSLHLEADMLPNNFLVLNSLSFLDASRAIMERHRQINLFLDRDAAGIKRTAELVAASALYKDCSVIYQEHKDLNQWLAYTLQNNQALAQARKTIELMARRNTHNGHSRGHGL